MLERRTNNHMQETTAEWITLTEAAQITGLPPRTLRHRGEAGYLSRRLMQGSEDRRWRQHFLRSEIEQMIREPIQFRCRPQKPYPFTPTPLECAYLAGIIDGEGCIRIRVSFHGVHSHGGQWGSTVSVTNTSLALLEWIRDRFGGFLKATRVSQGSFGSRPVRDWNVSNATARHILLLVEPFLVVKQEQARIAIALQARIAASSSACRRLSDEEINARGELLTRMNALNRRGQPPEET